MDPVHVRRSRASGHRQRSLLDERQGPLSHDHRDVLSEGATRRQNAVQRFPTQAFDGDVQLNIFFRLRYASSFFKVGCHDRLVTLKTPTEFQAIN